MRVSIKSLGALTMSSLAAGAAFAADLGDCGHPVARRSIPACSLLIEGRALPARYAELLLLRGTAYTVKGDNDLAIQDLNEAIRLSPNDADGFFVRGNAYYKKGEYQRAMADYDQASWLAPDHLGAYVARGEAYRKLGPLERGEGDPAFGVFERSLVEGSAGMNHLNQKYWQRVEERFTQLDEAIARNPRDADAHFNRASAYRSLGRNQYHRALADYDEVIRLNPENVKAYSWRAFVHDLQGQYERAIADMDQIIRAQPDDEKALSNRGLVYEHKGDHDRAIADYSKAIRIVSGDAPTSYRRDARLYAMRGRAYERKGERDKAIADYRKVVPLWTLPGANSEVLASVAALKRLGANLSDFPLFDDAQQVARFTELLRQYPRNNHYYRGRCDAYIKKRDYDRAIADCDQAIALSLAEPPSQLRSSLGTAALAAIHNHRGVAYRSKGELERAIHDFDRAIELTPSNAEHYHNRGQVHAGWRDYERAIEDYIQAIRLNPRAAEYYDGRGRAYEGKGEQQKATADFDKARQIRQSGAKEPLLVQP